MSEWRGLHNQSEHEHGDDEDASYCNACRDFCLEISHCHCCLSYEVERLTATIQRVRELQFVSEPPCDPASDSWDEALALARLDVLRALDGDA